MLRDPYRAYVDNGVVGSSPVQLVVAMYEAAIARTADAKACLESGDIWGRARAISKASAILMELMASLNPGVNSDIPRNLNRLYQYMLRRLQEAHLKKAVQPLDEVQNLLRRLLEGWYKVAEAERRQTDSAAAYIEQSPAQALDGYAGPLMEAVESVRLAVTA